MAPCDHTLMLPLAPCAGLHVLCSRDLVSLPEGIAGFFVFLLVELAIVGIVFGLLGAWLEKRNVAARITGMSASIRAADGGSGVPVRLPVTGNDPISEFAREINQAFDELERSRRELEESRDRYHHLFESGNDFLLVCAVGEAGTPYRILDTNALACRSLGYTREELLTAAPQSVIRIGGDFARDDRHLHSADLIPREGERIPVEATVHRIRLEGTPAILIIARDVTERRRLEKELMDHRYHLEELVTQRTSELWTANESLKREIRERVRVEQERAEAHRQIEKNIEQFAILTDHIRNPLQVVQGTADLIDDERTEKIKEQVRKIHDILRQLDRGWVESEKVRKYLERCR